MLSTTPTQRDPRHPQAGEERGDELAGADEDGRFTAEPALLHRAGRGRGRGHGTPQAVTPTRRVAFAPGAGSGPELLIEASFVTTSNLRTAHDGHARRNGAIGRR